jgi:hypothetical protein
MVFRFFRTILYVTKATPFGSIAANDFVARKRAYASRLLALAVCSSGGDDGRCRFA